MLETSVVSLCNKDGYEKCVIKDIEYRGAFYRLTVETEIKDEISVDLLSSAKEDMELENNKEIFCKIG